MTDLGVDYLDLYLIHFPIAQPYVPIDQLYPPEWVNFDDKLTGGKPQMVRDFGVTYQQTYQAMEQLVKKGLVRNIGVCNVGTSDLAQILSYCEVKPAVLQVEMHPYNTQQKLLRFAREASIQVMAFSNLGPMSYVELQMASDDQSLLSKPAIQAIAQAHSKTAAQVLLRWGVQRGTVCIPKSSKVERLIENISVFDFNLSQEEMATINGFNTNTRFNDPGVFCEAAFGCYCPIYD